ncbi:MAG: ATP-binding protein, partial [Candidatus Rokuibacteriota bacterium]
MDVAGRVRRQRIRFPLRYHLVALIVVALVPMVAFAAAIVLDLGRERRASVEEGLQTTVRALAIAVEREIAASIRALEVLATSDLLDRGDLAAFHAQAIRVVDAQEVWYVLALTDPRGQLLLNTVRPFGASLPSIGDRDYYRRLIATGRPAVSDLIVGRTTGQMNVAVAVPVRRDGALRYILFAAIKSEGLGRVLADQEIPADWIAGITDTNQVFIVRNRDPERFVGRELIAPLKRAVRAAPEGSGRFPIFDSPDVYAAWRRTPSLGWTVTLGAPVALVDAPIHGSVWRIALAGLVLALGGGAMATMLARRIAVSMSGLAASATALGHGAAPTCPPSPIAEIDVVARAISAAGSTIAQRTTEVRAGDARFKRLVDSSLIGILVCDDERLTDANDAFLRMVGYSREDLEQGPLCWPDLTPSEYKVIDEAARAAARREGECAPYEKEYRRKDGTRVPVLIGSVFFEADRHEWVSFALDLTERNRMETEHRLRIEAQAANRAKDEFLGMLSHELRTPLSAALNGLRVLRRKEVGPEMAGRILDAVERSTQLQLRLVEDLLDVARVAAGKMHVELAPMDLLAVVEDALSALRHEAEGKGVALRAVLRPLPGLVLGDAARVQQIAVNLIGNAIKFTPAGGEVDVSVQCRHSRAVLIVRDTGRGIEPELLPYLFDRFRQGAPVKGQGGLGLGLAIVRHLVEAHGGIVRAESAGLDRGAVFTVELPLA